MNAVNGLVLIVPRALREPPRLVFPVIVDGLSEVKILESIVDRGTSAARRGGEPVVAARGDVATFCATMVSPLLWIHKNLFAHKAKSTSRRAIDKAG